MFRAAVVSIVLTLAAGPDTSLLCLVWCHSEAASAGSCAHPAPLGTLNVAANDSCPDIAAGLTALVREDVRRGVSAPDGQHAVLVPPFQSESPPRHSPSSLDAWHSGPPEAGPLVLALRI